jgi:radical SAM enzyme (TIGR01210 family)
MQTTAWPASPADRDRFVLAHRGSRPAHDPWRHQGVSYEDERGDDGGVWRTATVFLTGRECPWRCVMCDLWMHTTTADTPAGAIVAQVTAALDEMAARAEAPAVLKLYNAGSFFDPRAVPEADYDAIAVAVQPFRRVVVEAHPALVGHRLTRVIDACRRAAAGGPAPTIEVAMGLETAHPRALAALHKRFTLEQFAAAAAAVRRLGADLRVFLLIGVPFVPRDEQVTWMRQSVETAFDLGAAVVSLIPTRPGNGALDALAASGDFVAPSLADVESALEAALPLGRARTRPGTRDVRVFADLWDLDRLASCAACAPSRRARLAAMNLTQHAWPAVPCAVCQPQGVVS